MSKIIQKKSLITSREDEMSEFVRENIKIPKHVRFNEVFEEYLSRHLQKYVHYERKLDSESVNEIKDFISNTLRKLFSKSSSNDSVTDEGINFISSVYMSHLNVNNVENIIIPLANPGSLAKKLSNKELRLYSEIFRMTEIGDICDEVLNGR